MATKRKGGSGILQTPNAIIAYEIDPGGDIELVLQDPDSHKIVPIINNKETKDCAYSKSNSDCDGNFANPSLAGRYAIFNKLNDAGAVESDTSETATSSPGSDKAVEVRMRVSSRHLILASRTFRAMLEGPWIENLNSDINPASGPRQIRTSGWNAAALAIVLDAIHGRHRDIPKKVNIGLFTRIASIVDYYDCHESLHLLSDVWMARSRKFREIHVSYCETSLLWLYVAWVFSEKSLTYNISDRLLIESKGLSFIHLEDLPLGPVLGLSSKQRLCRATVLTLGSQD